MKVTVDIDLTPEEARTFFGLPDVKPMQERVMKEMEDRMMTNMTAMDPETMIKTWMPVGVHSLDQLQKMFWSQMSSMGKSSDSSEDK